MKKKYTQMFKTIPKFLSEIETGEIMHLEAQSNYTYVVMKDGTRMLSSYNLKIFEELLETSKFMRINRSSLVNTSFITGYIKAEGYIKLRNNLRIKVPRRRSIFLKAEYPQIFKTV